MFTKERLLELLELKRGEFFSGEELAKKLFVSRNAVWKAVNALKNEGYHIDSQKNKGYSLAIDNDVISVKEIKKLLNSQLSFIELFLYNEVSSTNTVLQEKLMNSKEMFEGTVVIASSQTDGRGRRGKSFFSPHSSGIYISLLLKPENFNPRYALSISAIAAISICEAIEALSLGLQPKIKWVNDIFLNNKKICGILTEGQMNIETNSIDSAILGLGLNLYMPSSGFPDEIKTIAGPLLNTKVPNVKNKLVAGFLNHFMHYYLNFKQEIQKNNKNKVKKTDSVTTSLYETVLTEYKNRSFILGKKISVRFQNKEEIGNAIDIDKDYNLMVQFQNDRIESFSSAEISIDLL